MGDARRVVEDVFREESGKIVAGLIRQYGDFDLAEDALQDAFLAALDRWAADGTPDNPGAWITTTARRKAIDRLRRRQTQSNHMARCNTNLTGRPANRRTGSTRLLTTIDFL